MELSFSFDMILRGDVKHLWAEILGKLADKEANSLMMGNQFFNSFVHGIYNSKTEAIGKIL